MNKKIYLIILTILLSGCNTLRSIGLMENIETSYPFDACLMLKENKDWKKNLVKANQKYDVPISVILSIIKQESSFYHKARPINYNRKWFWQPKYLSSAYGFAQAIDGTWGDYINHTRNSSAKRTRFSDAVDFVGWYTSQASHQLGINKKDAYNLYLAYHEGFGNYRKRTYKRKKFLLNAANKVKRYSYTYSKQINHCNLKK